MRKRTARRSVPTQAFRRDRHPRRSAFSRVNFLPHYPGGVDALFQQLTLGLAHGAGAGGIACRAGETFAGSGCAAENTAAELFKAPSMMVHSSILHMTEVSHLNLSAELE